MGNAFAYSQTFEEWCIDNNRQDILDLWDYEKNDKLPSEVPRGTKTKYFFKCGNDIHPSESRRLSLITSSPDHKLICKQCAYHNEDDLLGQVFGELTVIEFDKQRSDEKKYSYWICKCSCGNIISTSKYKLIDGEKIICGKRNKHLCCNDVDDIDIFSPTYLRELRKSNEYNHYRQEVLKKDNYKCIICGTNKNLEVHHIYPFATYPKERLNPAYGICICKQHHNVGSPISFHTVYGKFDNTPEQLEDYVNAKRNELGINEHFDVYEYMDSYDDDSIEIDDSMMNIGCPILDDLKGGNIMKDYYPTVRETIDRYNQTMNNIANCKEETTDDDDEFLQNFSIYLAHALIKDTGGGQCAREELEKAADIINVVVR